jgi:predicted HTH transcriptional regulator
MEPALRPHFLIDEMDGETVAAVEIDEIPASRKPCFYKQTGLPKGAYLRVGNTNRQMTEYEVFGYLSSRGQPTSDAEIIADATVKDLDGRLLDEYLAQLRQARPGAGFLDGDRDEALARSYVVAHDAGIMRPTLAGFLMTLRIPCEHTEQTALQADEGKILAYVREHGTISNAECRKLLDVALHRASYLLRKLASEGVLKREGDRRWARYRLS